MLTEVKYTGLNQSASDYNAEAGTLATCHNLVNERGDLVPLPGPGQLIEYTGDLDGYQCVHVHGMVDGTKVYIFYKETTSGDTVTHSFRYQKDGAQTSSALTLTSTLGNEVYKVTSIGNTLCILSSNGMDYVLWKIPSGQANPTYVELGMELPFVDGTFALAANNTSSVHEENKLKVVEFEVENAVDEGTTTDWKVRESYKDRVKTKINAEINKLLTQARADSCFINPFLVRYAIRLTDGSLIHHSSPILMLPGIENPILSLWQIGGTAGESIMDYEGRLFCSYMKLQAKFSTSPNIANWKDVVSGVDIYISSDFRRHDYEDITEYGVESGESSPLSTSHSIGLFGTETSSNKYGYQAWNTLAHSEYDTAYTTQFRAKDVKVGDESLFYLVKSLTINDLSQYSSLTELSFGEKLKNLEVQPAMTDDYNSHDLIKAKDAFVYNERLNIWDISTQHRLNLSPLSYIAYDNTGVNLNGAKMLVKIEDGTGIYWLQSQGVATYAECIDEVRYLYVPYVNATEILLVKGINSIFYVSKRFQMKRHTMLNGAVYFNDYNKGIQDTRETFTPTTNTIYIQNKIYTSEVGNPYYFPLAGINTVGIGRIKALGTAVKTLGVGQFGQYPMFVFTDSGIWALEVNDEGLFKAKQPMSLDRILGEHVVPADGAIAYATERGVMLVSGPDSKCISDVLEGKTYTLPVELTNGTIASVPVIDDWREYKKDLSFAYDDVRQLLYCYNSAYDYSYVWSARTGQWSTCDAEFLSTINSSLVNTDDALLNLNLLAENDESSSSSDEEYEFRQGVLATRPVRFDTDALKKVRDNIQRGNFIMYNSISPAVAPNVKCILQGSRDLTHWYTVGSSTTYKMRGLRGSPYRWFRWLVVADLTDGQSLAGVSADVEIVRNDKLR